MGNWFSRKDRPPVRHDPLIVKPDRSLIISCLETLSVGDPLCQEMIAEYRWNPRGMLPGTRNLERGSSEFLKIQNLFFQTNTRCFRIVSIEKIYNPYVLIQYHTKKKYLQDTFGQVQEKLVFHGTHKSNVESIVNNNFNWRFRGRSKGHIFGQGISFSTISNYATHYGDKSGIRVMFFVRILMGRTTPGSKEMIVPPDGFDTTHKDKTVRVGPRLDHSVYVKYDDNTFCPTHVIYYYENEKY